MTSLLRDSTATTPLLPPDRFRQPVASRPLVSIDLLVEDEQGRFLLGRRRNPPAQDSWFVPGGRIHKDEPIAAALRRLLQEVLGLTEAVGAGCVEAAKMSEGAPVFRGVYEHFYDTNFANEAGSSTHYVLYVVFAYVLHFVTLSARAGPAPRGEHRTRVRAACRVR